MTKATTRRTIDTARGTISWLEAGAGWPVVLLHGFPLTAEMWRPQLERAPDDWRFIAPELSSAVPASGTRTIDDYARDISALIDALHIDAAVIGGLSMGGYITFALFRQAPALFSGMILADTRPQADSVQVRDQRAAMRALLAREGVSAIADYMIPRLVAERVVQEQPDVVRRVRAMIESNAPRAVDAALDAMMTRPDSTADLPRVSCATLVVVGKEDAVTPVTEADAMHRAIERSVLVTLPEAGHLSNLERPEAFSRALVDFLAAHW
jgi:pimeloyl-ACP methyl ester carboxylesterase